MMSEGGLMRVGLRGPAWDTAPAGLDFGGCNSAAFVSTGTANVKSKVLTTWRVTGNDRTCGAAKGRHVLATSHVSDPLSSSLLRSSATVTGNRRSNGYVSGL